MHCRNLVNCLCPDVLSFQHVMGRLARLPQESGPVTTRLLPNIWRQLCLIPHSLQQTSTAPPHVLLPSNTDLQAQISTTIPTSNYGVAFLKSLYPATAVCSSVSYPPQGACCLLQPQWEIPSPKSVELHPPQQLALGCGLCWVRFLPAPFQLPQSQW